MTLKLLFAVLFSVYANAQRTDFNTIHFKKADSIAASYKGASLKNLPVLTHRLTVNLPTEVEKFRAIYTWVSTTIENDYSAYTTTRKKRKKLADNRAAFLEWNSNFTPKVFKKLVRDKKTACTGYAYLIREMATLAGFECEIVNGFGRTPTLKLDVKSTPNHSWNKIKINEKWYLCDATWSAGEVLLEENGPKFKSNYFDGYFLASPSLFVKNHYPLEIESALLKTPPSFQEFVDGPVVYKAIFKTVLIPVSPKKMHFDVLKNENVAFMLQCNEELKKNDIQLLLNKGGNDREVTPKISFSKNKCVLEHAFKNTGLYDVHIQVNNTLIATYVIRVRKR